VKKWARTAGSIWSALLPKFIASLSSYLAVYWTMTRERQVLYRTAGGPHLAVRHTLNMKAPFEAAWSEFSSKRLWPFSARIKELRMRPLMS
jgi:hypothetical protein